jgi:hypothetical protein
MNSKGGKLGPPGVLRVQAPPPLAQCDLSRLFAAQQQQQQQTQAQQTQQAQQSQQPQGSSSSRFSTFAGRSTSASASIQQSQPSGAASSSSSSSDRFSSAGSIGFRRPPSITGTIAKEPPPQRPLSTSPEGGRRPRGGGPAGTLVASQHVQQAQQAQQAQQVPRQAHPAGGTAATVQSLVPLSPACCTPLLLADIDGDGHDELVAVTERGQLAIFRTLFAKPHEAVRALVPLVTRQVARPRVGPVRDSEAGVASPSSPFEARASRGSTGSRGTAGGHDTDASAGAQDSAASSQADYSGGPGAALPGDGPAAGHGHDHGRGRGPVPELGGTAAALVSKSAQLVPSHLATALGPVVCIACAAGALPPAGGPGTTVNAVRARGEPGARSDGDFDGPVAGLSDIEVVDDAPVSHTTLAELSSEEDPPDQQDRDDIPVISALETRSGSLPPSPVRGPLGPSRGSSDGPGGLHSALDDSVDNVLESQHGLFAVTSGGVLHIFEPAEFPQPPVREVLEPTDAQSPPDPVDIAPTCSLPCVLNASALLICDLTGGGVPDLVVGTSDGRVCVYSIERSGSQVPDREEEQDIRARRHEVETAPQDDEGEDSRDTALDSANTTATPVETRISPSRLTQASDVESDRPRGGDPDDASFPSTLMRSASHAVLTTLEKIRSPSRRLDSSGLGEFASEDGDSDAQGDAEPARRPPQMSCLVCTEDPCVCGGTEQPSYVLTLRKHWRVPSEVTFLRCNRVLFREEGGSVGGRRWTRPCLAIGQRVGIVNVLCDELLRAGAGHEGIPDGFLLKPSDGGPDRTFWFVKDAIDARGAQATGFHSPGMLSGSLAVSSVRSSSTSSPAWVSEGDDADEQPRPVFALCTSTGVLSVREENPGRPDTVLWELQLRKPEEPYEWLWVGFADVTCNGEEELVCCSDDGLLFVLDASRNTLRMNLMSRLENSTRWPAAHERLAGFVAGSFSVTTSSDHDSASREHAPSFVALTRGGHLLTTCGLEIRNVASHSMVTLMRSTISRFRELQENPAEERWSRQEKIAMFSSCLNVNTFGAEVISEYVDKMSGLVDTMRKTSTRLSDKAQRMQEKVLQETEALARDEAQFKQADGDPFAPGGGEPEQPEEVSMSRHRALS